MTVAELEVKKRSFENPIRDQESQLVKECVLLADLTHYIFVEVIEGKNLESFRGKVNRTIAEMMSLGKQVLDVKYSRTDELYSAMIVYKQSRGWIKNDESFNKGHFDV